MMSKQENTIYFTETKKSSRHNLEGKMINSENRNGNRLKKKSKKMKMKTKTKTNVTTDSNFAKNNFPKIKW